MQLNEVQNTSELKAKGVLLIPPHRYHYAYPVLIALLLAVIAIFAFTRAATVGAEESVVLSNGQEISLGMATPDLSRVLGGNYTATNDGGLYQYPKATANQSVEVLVFTNQGKVSAIQIIGNSANHLKQADAKIGTERSALANNASSRLKEINSQVDQIKQKGYKVAQARSQAYYLPDPCNETGPIRTIGVALAGQEAKVGPTKAIDCNLDRD